MSKYIEENYSLVFSSQEIEMTLDDTKFQGCFLCINDKQEKKYTLTEKRRLTLKTKGDRKTLEGYIDDYFTLHNISKDKKNLIYLFLYHMFTSNEGVLPLHKSSPIKIGKKCWISSDVIILKGVSIGDNCVIGAGCIIKDDIPSKSIVTLQNNLKIRHIEDKA